MHDTLLAIIPRQHLNTALSSFHRAGFGSVLRVLDADRAPVADQCERAGIGHPAAINTCGATDVVLVVHAPKRLQPAAAIAVACGAQAVELVTREEPLIGRATGQIFETACERRTRRAILRAAPVTVDALQAVAD